MHAIDIQKACLTFYDSFHMLLIASITGKAWGVSLDTAEKDLSNSQKQLLFRTREVMRILDGHDVENCLKSTTLRIVEHDMVALIKELTVALPNAIATLVEVVDQAQSNLYFFETFQEYYNRKEKEKRQAKVSPTHNTKGKSILVLVASDDIL